MMGRLGEILSFPHAGMNNYMSCCQPKYAASMPILSGGYIYRMYHNYQLKFFEADCTSDERVDR